MTEIYAIPFKYEESFIDFVRQYGRPNTQGQYTLYACTSDVQTENTTTLFLVRHDLKLPDNPSYRSKTIRVDTKTNTLKVGPKRSHGASYTIVSERSADRLTALVGPSPLAPGSKENINTVLFWIEAEEIFQSLVTMSMRLGCDRLQAAAIAGQGRSGSGRVLLLRAERPSFYIIDKALESADVEVFIPCGGGKMYVPWGTHHPFVHLWHHDSEASLFMRGLGIAATMSLVELPQWSDIYGLTRFTIDGLELDEEWGKGALPIQRFNINLQLVPATQRRDVHLWLLPISAQEHLERLLHMIPEEDLTKLMFAVQESPDGERHILIRERHTGEGREYIDFDGRAFGPYAGYPNLMLSVNKDLEPPLRKDRYRDIFQLVTGRLTLLWEEDGALKIIRVKENTFQPLNLLVDYIIGAATTELESMIQRTVFDFRRYENSPARPSEHSPSRKSPNKSKRNGKNNAPEAYEPEELDISDVPQSNTTPELAYPAARPEEEASEQLDQLAQREIELEEAIILHGQTTERWQELATIKRTLKKPGEEALCWQEAMWLCFAEEAEGSSFDAQIVQALEKRSDIAISRIKHPNRVVRARQQAMFPDADPGWIWLHIAYGATTATQSQGQLREWLTDSYKLLKDRASSMRTKDRWALWGLLLKANNDSTQEAKVRETMLDELTSRGLQSFEAPDFIRDRVYQSRFIQDQDADDDGELEAATVILDMIQRELEQSHDQPLSRVGSTILAYAYERLGNRGQSEHFSQQAERFLESSVGLTSTEQAWMALYLGATAELRIAGSGRPWVDRYNSLLKLPSSQSLARSELEVIQKSIFMRNQTDNPTEFFSPDQFRTFFSASTGSDYGEVRQIRDSLEMHVQRGKFAAALRELQDLVNRAANGQLNIKMRPLAWLLGPIVNILRRIGQATEGIHILRKLEDSLDEFQSRSALLYKYIFCLKLAEGYLDLGEEERGVNLISDIVQKAWKNKTLVWLDHLDMLGATLEAVEAAPLHHRPDTVQEILHALFITDHHPQDSEQYRPVKLRLLDHCVEVALSKEKLSLRRYKNYLDEDEFHVRYRIVNESLT